ncbi:MAG TPA: hypothetical protein DSN98_06910 [Thermoplasmata archaeon]|nr:MAG TPA: hypothetical protein DSN98_06910 [Thermoplasmata archaeon]
MKRNQYLWKEAVVTIIFLLMSLSVLPSTIGIQEIKKSKTNAIDSEEFNMIVSLKPTRIIFPRLYSAHLNIIGFKVDINNEGPDNSTEVALKFKIIQVIGREPGEIYNVTYHYTTIWKNQGRGHLIPWYSWLNGRFGVFEARATIDVDDTVLKDNTKSFYFILLAD